MSFELRPYGEMVSTLFKHTGLQVLAEPLVHAAIGVLGELLELAQAPDHLNFIEECGDAEFYLEAFLQSLVNLGDPLMVNSEMGTAMANELTVRERTFTGHELVLDCVVPAGDLLDLTKKVWVYNQPIETHTVAMAKLVGMIHGRLALLYAEHNLSREDVLNYNQLKLAKRYPDGVYSNGNAAARLDKNNDTTQETEGAASV